MKKKFINGLLIGALAVGFTSSMVSCKDYADQESVVDLQSNLAALYDAQKTLQNELDDLKAKQAACESTCEAFRLLVQNTYATITALNEVKTDLASNYYDKAEVESLIKQLIGSEIDLTPYQAAADVQALIDQALEGYTKDLSNYVNIESLNETILSLFDNQQDALQDALDNYIINILADYEPGLDEEAVKALIQQEIAGFDDRINAAQAAADAAKDLAQQALTLAQDNKGKIDALSGTVEGLSTTVTNLETTVNSLSTTVSNLENIVIPALDEKIADAIATANEAKAKAEANSLLIANLQDNYEALNTKVDALEGSIAVLKSVIEKNIDDLAALQERVAADEAAADAAHREILETISGLADIIENLQGQQDSNISNLQSQIDDILAQIQDSSAILNQILGVLDRMVTGIELNGTYNQFFGYLNLPVDVRSNMLVAFHGTTGDGINFPTDKSEFYALPDAEQWNVITEKDIEMLGGNLENVQGHVRMGSELPIVAKDGAAGNAGTIYLTVNPTSRDFSGTQFELVNSQNETSPVILENLQKSNKVLDFGWTRGTVEEQSGNGFYEAKATLKLEDVDKVGLNIATHEEIKSVISDIKNYRDGIDLGNLVQTVYSSIHSVLPAIAVKASWQDDNGVKSVVSQYGVGVTSIKPLSFGFAKEKNYDHVPGTYRLEKFIDRQIDKLKLGIPNIGTLSLNLENITLVSLSEDKIAKFNLTFTKEETIDPQDIIVKLPNYQFNDDGSIVTVTPTQETVTIHVEGQTLTVTYENDLTDEITELIDSVNDTYEALKEKVQDLLDEVNDYLAQMATVEPKFKKNLKEEVARVINAINKRFAKYMNPNQYMQPVLLVENGGYARLSTISNLPTRVTGTKVALAPTTYNLEVLSPAYKKFVAVTNVRKGAASAQDGDASCKTVLDKANAQNRIAEVIDGGFDDFLEFNVEPGYTYEILYTAVDYAGKNVAKKFYLTVNE